MNEVEKIAALHERLREIERQRELGRGWGTVTVSPRAALAKKLESREAASAQKAFGFNAATRRKLETHAKREQAMIRADAGQFRAGPIPKAVAELRDRRTLLRQLMPRRGRTPWSISDPRGVLLMGSGAALPLEVELTPPALAVEPTASGLPAIGEANIQVHSSGVGGPWGLEYEAGPPPFFVGITYYYLPQFNANVYATAQIDLAGTVYVNAHDHWYTDAEAILTVAVGCDLHQHAWDVGPPLTVIDERHSDSSNAYWFVNTYFPTANTTVQANDPLFVRVWTWIRVHGQSQHAWAEVDFYNGADKYIRVPRVTLMVVPI